MLTVEIILAHEFMIIIIRIQIQNFDKSRGQLRLVPYLYEYVVQGILLLFVVCKITIIAFATKAKNVRMSIV